MSIHEISTTVAVHLRDDAIITTHIYGDDKRVVMLFKELGSVTEVALYLSESVLARLVSVFEQADEDLFKEIHRTKAVEAVEWVNSNDRFKYFAESYEDAMKDEQSDMTDAVSAA